MSCTGCGSNFGVFKKEVGCEACGFGFCSKCCSKKLVTKPSSENVKQMICNKCFDQSSGSETKKSTYSPPLAHKKRMAAMANRSMSLGTGKQQPELQNATDKDIAERLQRLKRERNRDNIPDNAEIQERLAKLKGIDPAVYSAPPLMVYRPSDRRSSTEQTSDLIKQITEEVQLDAKTVKPEDEIAARLAKLKGEPPPIKSVTEDVTSVYTQTVAPPEEVDMMDVSKMIGQVHTTSKSEAIQELRSLEQTEEYKAALTKMKSEKEKGSDESEEDEDVEADKLIQQLLDVNMQEDMGDPESLNSNQMISPDDDMISSKEADFDPEEFPWCVICSEDAAIRCFSCDHDLYCMRCFRECHDSLDIQDHKTCPFLSPKK